MSRDLMHGLVLLPSKLCPLWKPDSCIHLCPQEVWTPAPHSRLAGKICLSRTVVTDWMASKIMQLAA